MSNRDISISIGKTVNLDNYELMRIDIGISRDLEKGEKRDKAIINEMKNLANLIKE